MITVIQRVERATVRVDGRVVGRIGHGALLFVGVEQDDIEADADATAHKIANLRWFPGTTPMDRTLAEIRGHCLVVSQFTLPASLRKGNRPSFIAAADPKQAERLYLRVAEQLGLTGLPIATGRFGAKMAVELVNDGPVTFVLRSRGGRIVGGIVDISA